jgi:hypothetical protein
MITLTGQPQQVPDVELAGDASLQPRSVHVADGEDGAVTQVVESGQKVVLKAGSRKLEVTTSGYTGEVSQPGTYLTAADGAGLFGAAATLRRYGWGDRLGKFFSIAGMLVWVPGVVGLALAVSGAVFLSAKPPTDRAAIVDAAKEVQAWVAVAPEDRIAIGGQCLDGLAGRDIPDDVEVDGVECEPAQPGWFEDESNAALVATIGGLITAVAGLFSSLGKLTFGNTP